MWRAATLHEDVKVAREPIHIDVSELVKNPICTGIQRVEREILMNWSNRRPLISCVFDEKNEQFYELFPGVIDSILNGDKISQPEPISLAAHHTVPLGHVSHLFNPEVFFGWKRSKKYVDLLRMNRVTISWLVYDFMPFLFPQHYPVGTPVHCMPYLLAMRDVRRLAFISNQTKVEFETKIIRRLSRNYQVFPLGGDGLKLDKQDFYSGRNAFVYFGTIEPRKNVAIILRAFEILWQRGSDLELFIIGRMDSRAQCEAALIDRLMGDRRFHYLGHAGDSIVRDVLRKARATIFVSAEEGFGIPPLESLAAGIPVITSKTLPSLNDLPKRGYVELETVSVDSVCAAVEMLSSDNNALRLWEEAEQVGVLTWKQFANNLSDWLCDA